MSFFQSKKAVWMEKASRDLATSLFKKTTKINIIQTCNTLQNPASKRRCLCIFKERPGQPLLWRIGGGAAAMRGFAVHEKISPPRRRQSFGPVDY
jgi:hypothetical protein